MTCVEAAWSRALGVEFRGDYLQAIDFALSLGIAPVARKVSEDIVCSTRGVLFGVATDTGNGHAVAYDHGTLFCSRQPPAKFDFALCEEFDFHPEHSWSLHPILTSQPAPTSKPSGRFARSRTSRISSNKN